MDQGSAEMVQALLDAGADPNQPRAAFCAPFDSLFGAAGSETPLYTAAWNGHSNVVIALAKDGAVPNTSADKHSSKLTPAARTALEDAWLAHSGPRRDSSSDGRRPRHVGIGCVFRLGIAYFVPVAAVTTIKLALRG